MQPGKAKRVLRLKRDGFRTRAIAEKVGERYGEVLKVIRAGGYPPRPPTAKEKQRRRKRLPRDETDTNRT